MVVNINCTADEGERMDQSKRSGNDKNIEVNIFKKSLET